MGRRRWNKKHPEKAAEQRQQQLRQDAGDPPVRLLALQPNSTTVAVAIGTRLAVVDYKTGCEYTLSAPPQAGQPQCQPHAGCLRVLLFSPDGRCLLTGGDDKSARLWLAEAETARTSEAEAPAAGADVSAGSATANWCCANAWLTPKKMSAGGFTRDGSYAMFADKFGDVLIGRVALPAPGTEQQPEPQQLQLQTPGSLLGHFCTIVTGVAASPCGRYLATSDKDFKVRVSVLPSEPLQGSYEIQCYCLGHQDFVSCVAFAAPAVRSADGQQQQQPQGGAVLLSGSGDGTVRMWDHVTGRQLASYVASAPAAAAGGGAEGGGSGGAEEEPSGAGEEGEEEGDGEEEGAEEGPAGAGQGDADGVEPQRRSKAPPCASVLSLAVSADGSTVAVVVEGEDEVQLLSLDWEKRALTLQQRLRWPDVRYPCQVAFGPTGHLWVVGGVPLPTARSVHVGVAQRGPTGHFTPCTDEVLSTRVRSLLEARVEEEEAKMAEGGELFLYSKHLRKPVYDESEALTRKRMRNDHKETQRLAALRLRQDEKAK
ncbi:hypothetical protein Agub_g12291, partial [Astrephomene gubernaculifera]